jgi:hypothetical protein
MAGLRPCDALPKPEPNRPRFNLPRFDPPRKDDYALRSNNGSGQL